MSEFSLVLLGNRIRCARKECGLTQKGLAEQTGLSADVRVDTPENKAFPVQDNGEEAEPARTDDTNARIIKMYKKGMSVTDISKELNVGQGEVKLTIALYGGNR